MLKEILSFFKTNKIYTALFLINLGVYGVLLYQNSKAQKDQPSEAVENFKQAEESLQQKIQDKGSLEAYLKNDPKTAFAVEVLTLLLLIALAAGLILDGFYIFKPDFRSRLENKDRYRSSLDWKVSFLFKIINLILFLNLPFTLLLGWVLKKLPFNENFYILFHTTLLEIFCFWLILHFIKKQGGSPKDLGLSFPDRFFPELKAAWMTYLGVLPVFGIVLVLLLIITTLLKYEPPQHPLVNILLEEDQRSPWMIAYSLGLAAFFGPMFEELFFRGLCYPAFKKRFGQLPAMIMTSAFFALIHDNTFAFWPIFVLGMALVFLYEKRGTLVAPMVLHITHNTIFLSYFFMAKNFVSSHAGG